MQDEANRYQLKNTKVGEKIQLIKRLDVNS
jgi:hypothetical protein